MANNKHLLLSALLLCPALGWAEDAPEPSPSAAPVSSVTEINEEGVERQRPGSEAGTDRIRTPRRPGHGATRDTTDDGAVPPAQFPGEIFPIPDRWRLMSTLGLRTENPWDPYAFNVLKGDRPLFDDWFVVLGAISDTVFEPRSTPLPIGVQTSDRAGSNDLFGGIDQFVVNQNVIASLVIVKGNTAYKPPDLELRVTPVFNINYADVEERRVLLVDPRAGTTRTDGEIGWQELFFDYHIRNVSTRYDFDSVRIGIQPFSTDFRGFLFQDNQLGVRLFGTRNNNLWQYNLAWFRRVEKDTNSGLNDFHLDPREDDVFIANLYRQDFPLLGLTSQFTAVHNRNADDGVFFDENGFRARPASIGDMRGRNYDVTYLGFNNDGRFGRYGLTTAFYYAFGEDGHNPFTSRAADIRALFFAAEPSMDFSWTRLRGSFLFASGDSDPFDNTNTGFDAIFENPQFAGGDTNYWIRQTIPLIGGGGVTLSPRNGVLPSLRSSKEQGQSNFINPGITLVGLGADVDVLPELRVSTNANYMWFNTTESLEALRQQGNIGPEIGADLSIATIYRPFFTQNFVFRLSGAMLVAGDGFKDLYGNRDSLYYSVLANLVLTY